MRIQNDELIHTYSIVAYDAEAQLFGVAVQTHQMGVGRLVPWLLPGYGAIATQSLVNISYGPIGLRMLREGWKAEDVLAGLTSGDPNAQRRQVACVDAEGRAAAFTGSGCIREAGHYVGEGYSVQANMMTRTTVIEAMRQAYETASGTLAERMMAALHAAQVEDGDIRGMQSAALKIVSAQKNVPDWSTVFDLRVDEHLSPLDELGRLLRLRQAQQVDERGYAALAAGDLGKALAEWAEARRLAPELEELAFWQAVSLADQRPSEDSLRVAARILAGALERELRRDQWLDLLIRLEDCGLIARQGTAVELLEVLSAL